MKGFVITVVLLLTLTACPTEGQTTGGDDAFRSSQPVSTNTTVRTEEAPVETDDSNVSDEQHAEVSIRDVFDDIIRRTEATSTADAPQSAALNTEAGISQFMDAVWLDLQDSWSTILTGFPGDHRFNYEWVTSGEVFTPSCPLKVDGEFYPINVTPNFDNAFYCSLDETVYMPTQTMIRAVTSDLLGTRLTAPGDAVVALVLAHEYSHGVADFMRQTAKSEKWPVTLTRFEELQNGELSNRPNELLADCLAGVWFYGAYYKGYLQSGDYEEIMSALATLGDLGDEQSHGTNQERVAAFLNGYNLGDTNTCINTHAPWIDINSGETVLLEVPRQEQPPSEQPALDVLDQLSNANVNVVLDGNPNTGLAVVQDIAESIYGYLNSPGASGYWLYEATDNFVGCDFAWDPLSVGYCDGNVLIGEEILQIVYDTPTYGELMSVLMIGNIASRHAITNQTVQISPDMSWVLAGDCISGAWLGSFGGSTTRDDMSAAYESLNAIFQASSPTTAERVDWFIEGYQTADPSSCSIP